MAMGRSSMDLGNRSVPLIGVLCLLALGCSQTDAGDHAAAAVLPRSSVLDIPDAALVPAFARLTFVRPVQITHAGDGTDRLCLLEQPGRVRVFENRDDVDHAGDVLDLRDKVFDRHNEEGLLSIAFHPKFRENRFFYVHYSATNPRRGVVSRFTMNADDPDRADPATEKVILEVEQPYGNHNGSTLLFGPDGFLYISLGDGGSANDPHGHGQNLSTLLGSVLRIDVDRESDGRAYSIPADNPFVTREGARGEIWAYGLRNIWRMSFDRATGDLWGGDVGQDRYEEIDLIVKGGNYGWNLREGFHPFKAADTNATLLDPVIEYGRREGISVTGGYVYRGKEQPGLRGAYIYADYVTRRVWALRYENAKVTTHREIISANEGKHITSFGEDEAGELFITAFDAVDQRGGRGRIYRLVER